MLNERRCRRGNGVAVILHLTGLVSFRDHGKTALSLDPRIATDIVTSIESVTGDWAKKRRSEERRNRRALRERIQEEKASAKPQRSRNTIVGRACFITRSPRRHLRQVVRSMI